MSANAGHGSIGGANLGAGKDKLCFVATVIAGGGTSRARDRLSVTCSTRARVTRRRGRSRSVDLYPQSERTPIHRPASAGVSPSASDAIKLADADNLRSSAAP